MLREQIGEGFLPASDENAVFPAVSACFVVPVAGIWVLEKLGGLGVAAGRGDFVGATWFGSLAADVVLSAVGVGMLLQ